jgi:hypothetical protein
LAQAVRGHLVGQFGVKEALLARRRKASLALERIDALLIGRFIVDARGTDWQGEGNEKGGDCQRIQAAHEDLRCGGNTSGRDYGSKRENLQACHNSLL